MTEIESLSGESQSGLAPGGVDRTVVQAANEPGRRTVQGASPDGRSGALPAAGEGEPMSYRDSASDVTTIGDALQQAREAAGLELDDVAAQLRIRRNFIAALEEGRADALPGVTYAIGYVRTYAAFLGLDAEQAVRRFKQEAAGLDQRTQLVFPSPAPEGRVPGVGLMFASVLLAGIAYGGWYWMSERGISVYDMVPEVPERLAALIEGETAVPRSAPTVSTAETTAPSVAAASSGSVASSGSAATNSAALASRNDYAAANPASVPVTARATGGAAVAGVDRSADETAPVPPTRIDDGSLVATAAPAVDEEDNPIPPTGARTSDPAPAQSGAVQSGAVQSGAVQSGAIQSGAVQSLAPAPTKPPSDPKATVSVAAASSPSLDARATARRAEVPSAPRLSGLIGASEAAVPDSRSGGQAPAAIERIVVRATGESWVQVRAKDGTTLFTRVLREGDVYRVPDRSGLTLATGNAGALQVVVDGTPAPSLGTFGEVVRNILLDPGRLAAGTAISGRN